VCRVGALAAFLGLIAALAGCARPDPIDMDKAVREEMKARTGTDVATVSLTRQPDGSYDGTVAQVNGDTYDVNASVSRDGWFVLRAVATRGTVYEVTASAPSAQGIALNAIVGQPTVERAVREDIERKMEAKVRSLALTRQGPGGFTGTATLENGTVLNVETKMDGSHLTWWFEPVR
jgi:hypothetical protein